MCREENYESCPAFHIRLRVSGRELDSRQNRQSDSRANPPEVLRFDVPFYVCSMWSLCLGGADLLRLWILTRRAVSKHFVSFCVTSYSSRAKTLSSRLCRFHTCDPLNVVSGTAGGLAVFGRSAVAVMKGWSCLFTFSCPSWHCRSGFWVMQWFKVAYDCALSYMAW